ncbi:MAG: substrate-binding domain-containing protein [bacterium]|nr:substrate-binding domain-containing protein [bacterium]
MNRGWNFLGLWLFGLMLWGAASVPVALAETKEPKRLAYLVSDLRIPFWSIMAKGVRQKGLELGYQVSLYSADNSRRKELENLAQAFKESVDGLIVSPTNSSACATILTLAQREGIPVVIADIGTDKGEYLSYISSDNQGGAYAIGKALAAELLDRGWGKGEVGVIAIPQKRANGQARTVGFLKAMEESQITTVGISQQVDFSYEETYRFSKELIQTHPDLRALWLQGSNRYQAALDAIRDAGKQEEILLVTFDAEPEFLDLIRKGVLVGAAMQQPFHMGEEAVRVLDTHFSGKPVQRHLQLPILAVFQDNLDQLTPLVRRNTLGLVP